MSNKLMGVVHWSNINGQTMVNHKGPNNFEVSIRCRTDHFSGRPWMGAEASKCTLPINFFSMKTVFQSLRKRAGSIDANSPAAHLLPAPPSPRPPVGRPSEQRCMAEIPEGKRVGSNAAAEGPRHKPLSHTRPYGHILRSIEDFAHTRFEFLLAAFQSPWLQLPHLLRRPCCSGTLPQQTGPPARFDSFLQPGVNVSHTFFATWNLLPPALLQRQRRPPPSAHEVFSAKRSETKRLWLRLQGENLMI
jgi:hypothetical protein